MKSMELYSSKLLLITLIICCAPFASASVGSLQGPGFHLLPVHTVSTYPTHSRYRQNLPQWRRYRELPSSLPAFTGTSRTPPHFYPDYRYRQLPPVTGYQPQLQPISADRRFSNYHWRPLNNQRFAVRWDHSRTTWNPAWRMAQTPYRSNQRPEWRALNRQYPGSWQVDQGYQQVRFRPVGITNSGHLIAQDRQYRKMSIPSHYRYRPLNSSPRAFPNELGRTSARLSPAMRVSDSHQIDNRWSSKQDGLSASPGYSRPYQPNSPFYYYTSANSRGPYAVRGYPAPSFPSDYSMRGYQNYRFRPMTPYTPPHYTYAGQRPARTFSAGGMMASSLTSYLRNPESGYESQTNGYPSSMPTGAASQNGWKRPEGSRYESPHTGTSPLVSQYDLDQRLMIDHDNNNF